MTKRILLTGGTGYLGRNLIKGLLEKGYEIIALVRKKSDISVITDSDTRLKIFRVGEVPLENIFKNHSIDVIIHTAANYGRKGESLSSIIHSNLSFPLEVLDMAVKYGVRYFINTDTALPKSLNSYSRSKKQFLEWLEVCSSSINVLNLQLEYFYGPKDDDSKFITYVLKELTSGADHIDFTEATSYRDFIYIDDVVDAYIFLLTKLEEVDGLKTVEIGSGTAIMLKDLVEKVQQLVGPNEVKLNFGALPMRKNEIMHSCADINFLEKLGWRPRYSLIDGITKMISIENS